MPEDQPQDQSHRVRNFYRFLSFTCLGVGAASVLIGRPCLTCFYVGVLAWVPAGDMKLSHLFIEALGTIADAMRREIEHQQEAEKQEPKEEAEPEKQKPKRTSRSAA